jgi:hypothetical protein
VNKTDELIRLAEIRFPALREAELRLLRATPLGEIAWCGTSQKDFDPGNDPAKSSAWGAERSIRAGLVRWLCIDREAREYVDPRGVQVHGARVDSALDLSFAHVPFPLALNCCSLREEIRLRFLRIPTIALNGSWVRSINAECAEVEGTVSLSNGFCSEGEVQLVGAAIGNSLDCGAGRFRNFPAKALRADRIRVRGSVFLRNAFVAEGEVRLLGAEIGGNLECNDGTFSNPTGTALGADRASVQGSVFLRDGFAAKGEVRLLGARVGGNVECNGGNFKRGTGLALNAERISVKGNFFLHGGFTAEGEVHLRGAHIGNNLACDAGVFKNPGGTALNADGINVRGYVSLRNGLTAEGEVNFLSAQIGDNLECDGGSFLNSAGKALNADRINVQGDISLRNGFTAEGEVSLASSLTKGTLVWTEVKNPQRASLNLSHATAGAILDDQASWPPPAKLSLDGFVYDHIISGLTNAKSRLAWLALQVPFTPGPYRQLAKVMRNSGFDRGALRVLFTMEDRLWKEERFFPMGLLRLPLRWVVGYGYYPLRALLGLVILMLIGWGVFAGARSAGALAPKDQKAYDIFKTSGHAPSYYEPFSPLVFSIENSLPLVRLGQIDYWQPDPSPSPGHPLLTAPRLLFGFQRLQVLLGWVLATLFVAGVSGIVQKQ